MNSLARFFQSQAASISVCGIAYCCLRDSVVIIRASRRSSRRQFESFSSFGGVQPLLSLIVHCAFNQYPSWTNYSRLIRWITSTVQRHRYSCIGTTVPVILFLETIFFQTVIPALYFCLIWKLEYFGYLLVTFQKYRLNVNVLAINRYKTLVYI